MKGPLDMHSRYRELLAARLDGPLTRPELRDLTSHLRKCATCREVDREYREQRGMLRSLPPPTPPRDLWARTSGAIDREVARGSYRRPRYGRAFLERRRRNSPSPALLSALAVLSLTAAIAVMQMAPVPRNLPTSAPATPFAVPPQRLAFVGAGLSDLTIYRTHVSQVCPPSAADCAVDEPIERTAVTLPGKMRPRNVALNSSGSRLAFVGYQVGEDVIAVVTLPAAQVDGPGSEPGPSGNDSNNGPTEQPSTGEPTSAATDDPNSTDEPVPTNAPGGSPLPSDGPEPNATSQPNPTGEPTPETGAATEPPPDVVAGMTVVAILDNVQSAGAPPAWSADGETLAFSAMPADGSHGPDVYVWSAGDQRARPLTDDHSSYFASWSGRRIVASRFASDKDERAGAAVRNVVIDPISLEQRPVEIGASWLPLVSPDRARALVWYGDLDLSERLPEPRAGALYVLDWAHVDPFADGAAPPPTSEPEPTASPSEQPSPEPTEQPSPEPPSPEPSPEPSREPSPEPTREPTPEPSSEPIDEPNPDPSPTPAPAASGDQSGSTSSERSDRRTARSTTQPLTPPDAHPTPSPEPTPEATPEATPEPTAQATPQPADLEDIFDRLIAVEPDRDPTSDPVREWQAQWSTDGQVVGIWVADAVGSTWGRLVVHAVDVRAELGLHSDPLLSATLARRGFALGSNRVAWVAPSDDHPEGELRVRTWGSDGVGGWDVQQLDGEEVMPAF